MLLFINTLFKVGNLHSYIYIRKANPSQQMQICDNYDNIRIMPFASQACDLQKSLDFTDNDIAS